MKLFMACPPEVICTAIPPDCCWGMACRFTTGWKQVPMSRGTIQLLLKKMAQTLLLQT